jgi:hypothetical protein
MSTALIATCGFRIVTFQRITLVDIHSESQGSDLSRDLMIRTHSIKKIEVAQIANVPAGTISLSFSTKRPRLTPRRNRISAIEEGSSWL